MKNFRYFLVYWTHSVFCWNGKGGYWIKADAPVPKNLNDISSYVITRSRFDIEEIANKLSTEITYNKFLFFHKNNLLIKEYKWLIQNLDIKKIRVPKWKCVKWN